MSTTRVSLSTLMVPPANEQAKPTRTVSGNSRVPLSALGVKVPTGTRPVRAPAPAPAKPTSRWSMQALGQGAKDLVGAIAEGGGSTTRALGSFTGRIPMDSPDYTPLPFIMDDPNAENRMLGRQKEVAERQDDQNTRRGFQQRIRNPLDALANEGLTSDVVRAGTGIGAIADATGRANEYVAFRALEERKLQSRQRILANPEQFPPATVEAAKAAQAQYEADEAKTVMDKGGEIVDTFNRDRSGFGADVLNSLQGDPALTLAPAGAGVRPFQIARAARGVAGPLTRTTAKATTYFDNVADAAITGAAANVVVDGGIAASQYRNYTVDDAMLSSGIGAVTSGAVPGVMGIPALLSRGSKARASLKTGKLTEDDLDGPTTSTDPTDGPLPPDVPPSFGQERAARVKRELGLEDITPSDLLNPDLTPAKTYIEKQQALKQKELEETFRNEKADADYHQQRANLADGERMRIAEKLEALAAEQALLNRIANEPDTIPPSVQQIINEQLGITDLTPAQKKAFAAKREAEIKASFKENKLDADFWQWLGDNSAKGRESANFWADAETKAMLEASELARQKVVAREMSEARAERTARYAQEFEAALAQRAEQEAAGNLGDPTTEAGLRAATERANAQDVLDSLIEGRGVPEVERALNRARNREAKVWRPKKQGGEIDRPTLIRLGLGSALGLGAYTLAEEDYKLGASFAAGFAALVIPGGGKLRYVNLGRRLQEVGAVSSEGDLVSFIGMVKDGLRKSDKDVEGEMVKTRKMLPTIDVVKQAEIDRASIAKVMAGDQTGVRELTDTYYDTMVNYANRRLGKVGSRIGQTGEDVAQVAFTYFFRNLDSYDPSVAPLGAYLTDITKKAAMNLMREGNTQKRNQNPVSLDSTKGADGEVVDFGKDIEAALDDTVRTFKPQKIMGPEQTYILQQNAKIVNNTLDKVDATARRMFLLNRVEGYTAEQIAEASGTPVKTVVTRIKTTGDKIQTAVAKGLNAKTPVEAARDLTAEMRISRKPKGQGGFIDPDLLKAGALLGTGAAIGYGLGGDDRNLWNAAIGALVAGGLKVRFRNRKGDVTTLGSMGGKVADDALGAISTRVKNISERVHQRLLDVDKNSLKKIHDYTTKVAPFLLQLHHMDKTDAGLLTRAMLTGKPGVVEALLAKIGDPELTKGWKDVRSVIDSLKDQLIALNRIKDLDIEYFPRLVNDVKGLLGALNAPLREGLEAAIKAAQDKSQSKNGRPLNEYEISQVVSRYLKESPDGGGSSQPGFAKRRRVEEITPELQQFYASPAESLTHYIRNAVEDIEKAKFFGEDIKVNHKNGVTFTNDAASIDQIVTRMRDNKEITDAQVDELRDLIQARFAGDSVPNAALRAARDVTYMALLGNWTSAAVQLTDPLLQLHAQGFVPTVRAIARIATNRKLLDMKDFGLENHIMHELADGKGGSITFGKGPKQFKINLDTAKALNRVFKLVLFNRVDRFTKDVALNAAAINFANRAKTPEGIKWIEGKYGQAFAPGEVKQLIKDLQNGDMTDLVQSVAFGELSRTQPTSKLQMPVWYNKHPNGRLMYMLKTWTLKQVDYARREVYNEMAKGTPAGLTKGAAKAANLALILGTAGIAQEVIRDLLSFKEVEIEDGLVFNILKNYALSEYVMDTALGVSKEEAAERRAEGNTFARSREGDLVGAAAMVVLPPYKMFEEIYHGDPKIVRYIPVVGKPLHDIYGEEIKEIVKELKE